MVDEDTQQLVSSLGSLRGCLAEATSLLDRTFAHLAGGEVEEEPLVVYLAHPVSGDVAANLANARAWVEWIYRNMPHVVVLSQWILDCELLDDSNPTERAQGFARNRALVGLADELWAVGGSWSSGMIAEREMAEDAGAEVVDATSWTTPPSGMVVEFAHAEYTED